MSKRILVDRPLLDIRGVEFTPRRRGLILTLADGKVLITKRSLTQLARHFGFTKKEFTQLSEDEVYQLLVSRDDLMIGVVQSNDMGYAYRVVTTRYQSVPHTQLVEYVENVLNLLRVKPISKEVVRFSVGMGFTYYISKNTINYISPQGRLEKDEYLTGIQIYNANTGNKAIRVRGYIKVLVCQNGMYSTRFSELVTVYHIKGVEKRLQSGLKTVVKRILGSLSDLQVAFNRLPTINSNIYDSKKEEILNDLPNRWSYQLDNLIYRYEVKYGRNLYALWGATTELMRNTIKIRSIHEKLNKFANELLEVTTV